MPNQINFGILSLKVLPKLSFMGNRYRRTWSCKGICYPEECTKESEKLITQKLKKGYTELAEGEAAPEKREYSEEEKADYFFWEAIEKSYKYNKKDWKAYDLEEHLEKTRHLLI